MCFLHSYADPSHELAMRDVLRREHPDAVVSLSCEVLREYREYERSVTTLVDAAVKPAMNGYLARIAERVAARLLVMKSNGGVLGGRGRAAADHDGAVGPRRRGSARRSSSPAAATARS